MAHTRRMTDSTTNPNREVARFVSVEDFDCDCF
jgi:hypothetical protein